MYPHHCILSDALQIHVHCCLFMIGSKNAWQKHILTMSFMRDALVGMVCSPRRLAKRRDLSRAISSNSRCFSVSLSDTGIGMASVASITRDAILIKKGRKHKIELLKNTNLLDVALISKGTDNTCTSKQCIHVICCIILWMVNILFNMCWKLGQWCKSESSVAAHVHCIVCNPLEECNHLMFN